MVRPGTGRVAASPRAPVPIDPFTLFESGEIINDGIFRISMHRVVEDRDPTEGVSQ
jgi:hypothetical protein